MCEIMSNWLTCKKCSKKGKYKFNTEDVLYDYERKKLILNWNLSCKFCETGFKLNNLTNSGISMLYCLILIRNIDDSV